MLDPIKRFTEELRALNCELDTPGLRQKDKNYREGLIRRIKKCFEESEKYRKLFCNTSSFKPMDELSEQLEKLKRHCEIAGFSEKYEEIRKAVSRLPLRVFQLGESLDLQRLTVGQEGLLPDKEYVSLFETDYKTRQFAKRKENLLYSINRGVPIRYLMNTEEELDAFLRAQGKNVHRLNLDGCAPEKPGLPKPKFSLNHLDLRGTSVVLMRRTYLHLLEMGVQVESDRPFPWDDPESPPLSVEMLRTWKSKVIQWWNRCKSELEEVIQSSEMSELQRSHLMQEIASISEDNLMSIQLSQEDLYLIILLLEKTKLGGFGSTMPLHNFIEAYFETNPTNDKQIRDVLRVYTKSLQKKPCSCEIVNKLNVRQLKEIVFDQSFKADLGQMPFLIKGYLDKYQMSTTPENPPTKQELKRYLNDGLDYVNPRNHEAVLLRRFCIQKMLDLFVKKSFEAKDYMDLSQLTIRQHPEIFAKITECFIASKPSKDQILEFFSLSNSESTEHLIKQFDVDLLKELVFSGVNFFHPCYPMLMNEYLTKYQTFKTSDSVPTREELKYYLEHRLRLQSPLPQEHAEIEYKYVLNLLAKSLLQAADYIDLFEDSFFHGLELQKFSKAMAKLFIASKPTQKQFEKILSFSMPRGQIFASDVIKKIDMEYLKNLDLSEMSSYPKITQKKILERIKEYVDHVLKADHEDDDRLKEALLLSEKFDAELTETSFALNLTSNQLKKLILSNKDFKDSTRLNLFCGYLMDPKVVDDPDFEKVLSHVGLKIEIVLEMIVEKKWTIENTVLAKWLIASSLSPERLRDLLQNANISKSKQMKDVIQLVLLKQY
jgi:hypothetical protein